MQPNYNPQGNAAISLDPVSQDLRYIFIAQFEDGSQYAQDEDDKSQFFEGKSAFYDILYLTGRLTGSPEKIQVVTWFYLTDKRNYYTVCLLDGHFEINGFAFQAHPKDMIISGADLIFFREYEAPKRFFMGWQTEDHIQTIGII